MGNALNTMSSYLFYLTEIRSLSEACEQDVSRLTDSQLLSLHSVIHKGLEQSCDSPLPAADYRASIEEINELHPMISVELERRAFKACKSCEESQLLSDQQAPCRDRESSEATDNDFVDVILTGEELIEELKSESLTKGARAAFGSYGGKQQAAHKIASLIPFHRTYIEPFAGGAAVLYAKDPSPKEVLNDRDSEIAFMHRFIRDMSTEDRQALGKRDWTIRRETHDRLKKLKAETPRDRFYKAYYLTRSSYGRQRGKSFSPANEGLRIDFPNNVDRAKRRLFNVKVSNRDYFDVIKEYDAAENFFYIDPPYPGTFNLFDFGFDEKLFLKALDRIKSNWIVSYTADRANVFKGFHLSRIKRRNRMRGRGGNDEWVTELLVSNFPLKPVNLFIEKEQALRGLDFGETIS